MAQNFYVTGAEYGSGKSVIVLAIMELLVAETDLYPSFSLLGSIGFQSSDTGNSSASDLFDSDSLAYSVGPAFSWNILNYGRIKNNVRIQDARYQQAIVNYQNTVLTAYQEVEDAMIGFIQARKERDIRAEGAYAAKRSSDISNIQYREGTVDFQRVIDSDLRKTKRPWKSGPTGAICSNPATRVR